MMTIRSLTVSGTLNENDCLTYKLYPSSEFSNGVWQMCITSVGISTLNEIPSSQFALINCNLIKDLKITDEYNIDSFYPTITTILLDCPANKQHKIQYLPENWFTINNYSEDLKFFFLDPTTKQIVKKKFFILMHILLKKMG